MSNGIARWFINLSLQFKVAFAFLICAAIPMIIASTFFYNQLKNESIQYKSDRMAQDLVYWTSNLNNQRSFLYNNVTSIYNDRNIMNLLSKAEKRELSVSEQNTLKQYLVYLTRLNLDISSAFLSIQNTNIMYYSKNSEISFKNVQEIYQTYRKEIAFQNGKPCAFPTIAQKSGGFSLPIGMLIRDNTKSFASLANMIVCYDDSVLSKTCDQIYFTENSKIYITNANYDLLWSNSSSTLSSPINYYFSQKSGEETNHIFIYHSAVSSREMETWHCLILVPEEDMIDLSFIFSSYFIILFLIFLLLSSTLFLILKTFILTPLHRMIALINISDLKNPQFLPDKGHTDEFGVLYKSFNNMYQKNLHLLEIVKKSQKEQSRLEYEALKAQINPHFLYNTLDTIHWMAIEHNEHKISDTVTALCSILRYSIKKSNEKYVTLSEELTWTKNYIFIQKQRFEDRFSVTFDIDESLSDCLVFHLILQPFIENAIIYGMKNTLSGGVIHIRIFSEKSESLLIQIFDNGVGMDPKHLEAIQLGIGVGIGIYNIDQLIKLNFGYHYGVTIHSELGIGTEVHIRFPIKR